MAITAQYNLNWNGNDALGVNNGTSTNVTYTAGLQNQAASFNGSSSSVDIADNAVFDFWSTANFTIDYLCYALDLNSYRPILNQRVGSTGAQFNIAQAPGSWGGDQMQLFIYDGWAGISSLSGNNSHAANIWEYWWYTRSTSGTALFCYKNGILVSSSTGLTARNANNTGTFYLGRDTQWSWRNWLIDKVRIRNDTQSAGQMKTSYLFIKWFI